MIMAGPRTLFGLFMSACEQHAEREALVYDDGQRQQLNVLYRELGLAVAGLAHDLRSKAGTGKRIGIRFVPSLDLVAGMLSVLGAECVYVPLLATQPPAQTRSRLLAAGARLVLCPASASADFAWLGGLEVSSCAVICSATGEDGAAVGVDADWVLLSLDVGEKEGKEEKEEVIESVNSRGGQSVSVGEKGEKEEEEEQQAPESGNSSRGGESVAYVLSTSGTTGDPVVVQVPNSAIATNVLEVRDIFGITPADTVLLSAPCTFDPSVIDIFTTLASGARLLVVLDSVRLAPRTLLAALVRNKATVLHCTPSLYLRFPPDLLRETLLAPGSPLRLVALGGEEFPKQQLEALHTGLNPTSDSTPHAVRYFNIYGTTEVSCWAMGAFVDFARNESARCSTPVCARHDGESAPLGSAFPSIQAELRGLEPGEDETGGAKELWIGGPSRVCMLGSETLATAPDMRSTGDVVERCSSCGRVWYLGRKDDQFKRAGHRMHPAAIEHALLAADPGIRQCKVLVAPGAESGTALLAFLVHNDAGSQDPKTAGDSTQVSITAAARALAQGLSRAVAEALSSAHAPDEFFEVRPQLPMTANGKIDSKALLKLLEDAPTLEGDTSGPNSRVELLSDLVSLARGIRGDAADALCDAPDVFLVACGFSSFDAVRLAEALSRRYGPLRDAAPVTEEEHRMQILDLLLHSPVADVLDHLSALALGSQGRAYKRARRDDDAVRDRDTHGTGTERATTGSGALPQGPSDAGPTSAISRLLHLEGKGDGSFDRAWRVNTHKCVDASPLLVTRERDTEEPWAIIGSHSGHVVCVRGSDGEEVWRTVLPGRVEASAALAHGDRVVVGCYDHSVYVLDLWTGNVVWKFDTNGIVKCAPCVDPATNAVLIGSHDGQLYCIDVRGCRSVWEMQCQASVFATPAIDGVRHVAVAATLGGVVMALCACRFCLTGGADEVSPSSTAGAHSHCARKSTTSAPDQDSQRVLKLWERRLPKPVFSSPAVMESEGHVVLGCVDANIYCLDIASGVTWWSLATEGPVFSSPCHVAPASLLLVGSHDHNLYAIDRAAGTVRWAAAMGSAVYASPCVVWDTELHDGVALSCSIDGTVACFRLSDGERLASTQLPGQVFSSPVCCAIPRKAHRPVAAPTLPSQQDRSCLGIGADSVRVLVGSRDNYLYGLSLSARELN